MPHPQADVREQPAEERHGVFGEGGGWAEMKGRRTRVVGMPRRRFVTHPARGRARREHPPRAGHVHGAAVPADAVGEDHVPETRGADDGPFHRMYALRLEARRTLNGTTPAADLPGA